jgi:choline dehydrogenase-like flavoprotein
VEVTWAQDAWPKTIINAGYKSPKDPRTGSSIGGFNQLVTVDPKLNRRSYSARAYYEPNAGRPNLSLLTHALVSRIVLEKTGGEAKATGIEFCSNGKSYSAKANKEVIVSGGTINSPQLLELSGIGSSAVLQKAGVDVVVDNPNVGENLNDHSVTGVCLVSCRFRSGLQFHQLTLPPIERERRVPDCGSVRPTSSTGTTSHGSVHQVQNWTFCWSSYYHRFRFPRDG